MDPSQDLNIAIVLIAATAVILFVVVLVGFVLARYHNRAIRQRIALQEQETQFQKDLLDTAIQTQEQERKRIAKDMHDEVGAMLSAIKLHLGRQDYLGHPSEKHKAANAEIKGLLDETLTNVRRISHDLLPPTLEQYGLWTTLENLVETVGRSGSLQVHLKGRDPGRLSQKVELGAYRIVQELMQNTIKHAQAKTVELRLESMHADSLTLVYRDDGVGWKNDPAQAGLGMKNLASRANNMAAALQIESNPGKGMRATLDIPLATLQTTTS